MSTSAIRIRAAAILLHEGRVLLVEHAKAGRHYWLLPGGGVDYGESLAEAVARELREELHLVGTVHEPLLINDAIDPEGGRHLVQVGFRVTLTGQGEPKLGIDPRVVGWAWHPIADLGGLEMYPAIGPQLRDLLESGDRPAARYLGNLWKA
ncbi:MAG: NUDIX hydrolase [Candidatus Hydrogenedentes bacterium]|nr:NUDIX hydrolase [Candidatus Hydrogenedentota bacterium]